MKNSYFSTDRGGRLQYQNIGLLNGKSVAKLKGYGPLHVIIYNPKNNTRTWYWEDKEGKIRSTTEFRRYDNIDFISTINDHKVRIRDNLASTNWLAIDYARYTPDELKNTSVYHPDNLYKIFDKCFECDFILHPDKQIRFNRRQNRLYIDSDYSSMKEDDYLIIECYRTLDPNEYTKVYNDPFLKRYFTALLKRQWGMNLIKYQGVKLPGGVELNGRQIYDDGVAEITSLEEKMSSTYELPVMDMIG
mgnify:CR=1 FL=1